MSSNTEVFDLVGNAGHHGHGGRARRTKEGVPQFPVQILIPEETREALRQRSADTGASIRHIILRSLAADGFPVPKPGRRHDRLS
jgi:hypothetical protein